MDEEMNEAARRERAGEKKEEQKRDKCYLHRTPPRMRDIKYIPHPHVLDWYGSAQEHAIVPYILIIQPI